MTHTGFITRPYWGFRRRWLLAVASWLVACLATAPPARAFDGERALDLIREQCNLGPRVPGTPAHERARQWLRGQVESVGWIAREDPFDVHLPLSGAQAAACNVWGLPAEDGPTSPAIILSAHWDTRPWADQDPAAAGRPAMDGANDGASGVAAVLELARELKDTPLRRHVVLAFWDAEDAGLNDRDETWALGARHAAAHPPTWIERVALGINLDLVAGEDLRLRRERRSLASAPRQVGALWSLGAQLAPEIFVGDPPAKVTDDHVPWIEAGVPYIDLVGLPYSHWHTSDDTAANCSAAKLGQVGMVVYYYVTGKSWRPQAQAAGGHQ
ncbi:MAG: M28 family peptidase [bacterium]|nr:M28 family peptidase [bacterium]